MRVVANLSSIVSGQVGGTEQYSVRLLQALADHADNGSGRAADLDLTVVGHRSLFEAHSDLRRFDHCQFVGPVGWRLYRVAVESSWLARRCGDTDLVHHFAGRLPAHSVRRTIVTVHDLQPLDLADNFTAVKQRYLRWAIPRSVRAADLVCTPSAWVATRLMERFGLRQDRIKVVSSTPGAKRSPSREPTSRDRGSRKSPLREPTSRDRGSRKSRSQQRAIRHAGSRDRTIADIGDRPMVLFPAITHPHKNHCTLIDAVAGLRDSHPELLLILTGAEGRSHQQVKARIRSVDPERRLVRHLGRVDAETLSDLFARADLVAFPSRYEGFGLPVIEAMHHETPVIAANRTALPEVVGGAAELIDPDDTDAWAGAIGDLLGNEARRNELVRAGRSRAAHYSAPAAAKNLLTVWRDALS